MDDRAQKYRFLPAAVSVLTVLAIVGVGIFLLVRHFLGQEAPADQESGAGNPRHPAAPAAA